LIGTDIRGSRYVWHLGWYGYRLTPQSLFRKCYYGASIGWI